MSGDKSIQYETKTLPSGIVVENKFKLGSDKYRWSIKGTIISHNEGEPAAEYNNGSKVWLQHDKLHRLDGPASEEANGCKRYYMYGALCDEKTYWNHPEVIAYKEKMTKTTQYETKTLPSGIVVKNIPSADFKYQWVNEETGLLHNEGEPAFECKDGNKYWIQHGKTDIDTLHSFFIPWNEEDRWASNGFEGAANQRFVYQAEWVLSAALGFPHGETTFEDLCKERTKTKQDSFSYY